MIRTAYARAEGDWPTLNLYLRFRVEGGGQWSGRTLNLYLRVRVAGCGRGENAPRRGRSRCA